MKRELHDGAEDHLEALESLEVTNLRGLNDLLTRMARTAFGGRELGEAYKVLKSMASDPDCTIILTIAGAMTVAKMSGVICAMIENGLADLIVSTGALMAHGLSESMGRVHYRHNPDVPDADLYKMGYNRVYDTLEMEANLVAAEELARQALRAIDPSHPTSSAEIHREIGRKLFEANQMPSILGCAFKHGIPVYVPAFTDSALGLAVAIEALGQSQFVQGSSDLAILKASPPQFNPFRDLLDFAHRVSSAKRLGIFTIGGGVPRNWGQQIGPFIDILNEKLGTTLQVPRIRYGVRICPEPVHWGGLSGCTYEEGMSWGKFLGREEGGMFAEVHCDATIAWPLLIGGLLESKNNGAVSA